MKAHYGYEDGSGRYFIIIDTDLCDGCGDCVTACPVDVIAVGEDENDPLSEDHVAFILNAHRRTLGEDCSACKTSGEHEPLPCVDACRPGAIRHSW